MGESNFCGYYRISIIFVDQTVLIVTFIECRSVGVPFISALAAPTVEAELRHIMQAAMPLIAVIIARPDFAANIASNRSIQ